MAIAEYDTGQLEKFRPFADGLDPQVASTVARYQLPQDVDRHRLLELMRNLHRLNVLATYRALEPPNWKELRR